MILPINASVLLRYSYLTVYIFTIKFYLSIQLVAGNFHAAAPCIKNIKHASIY